MIQVDNLRKSFGQRAAVNDLSFRAADGAITGLLGSNGAGKTTTLRMISGVLRPDSGTIAIDGGAADGDPLALRRRIGSLLDHTGIYSRLTVRENLEYFGRLHNMAPDYLRERVAAVVAILGLGAIADRRTAGFSQGEHMKTALGRALLHNPRNVLLDEPTNGLDIPTVRSLRDLLRRLRDAGTCIVFSSHVLEEVRALCDRVVILAEGRVAAEGTPEAICAQTGAASLEDAFVALTCRQEALC